MSLIEKVSNIFFKEIKNTIKIMFSIMAVSILCGVLKNIQSSFGGNVSEIAFYVCYIFIVILIINSYTEVVTLCTLTISRLTNFLKLLTPLILGLLISNGSITTVGTLKPVLLLMMSAIDIIISKVILPIILASTVLGMVSNISDDIEVSKLPKFLQKVCIWCLELMLIIFVGILSIEGTLAASIDGVTVKGVKTVVSTVIPIVGKALSDATDSILGATVITKNSLGVLGVIVILGISLLPILKVLSMMLVFNLGNALMEPMVDKRISKCIGYIGDSIKVLFALLSTVCVLFILSTTLMIKMGNFSVMYH